MTSETAISRLLAHWFERESIGGDGMCPTYLWRWTLLRLGQRAVYLHHFVGDDWVKSMKLPLMVAGDIDG